MHVLHQIAVPTSDHWRILQRTFRCFQTKTHHVARRMKSFRKGHVTCRMLSIKRDCFLICFVQNIRYLVGTSDVATKSNNWGKYSSDFVQNWVLLCSSNAWIGTHATFPLIPKQCCHFSVVQNFQFEITTHLMYLQDKYSWSIDRKYNYHERWCYLYKTMFSAYKSVIVTHVLVICL